MESKEYYSLLQIDRNASQEDVKKAYRKLAMKFHPDVDTDKDAEEKFKALGEAYSVLGDTGKRRVYDRTGKTGLTDPYTPIYRPEEPCMGKCSGLDALFRRKSERKKNITAG